MSDLIKDIFSQNLKFEGINEIDRFVRIFSDLYKMEIYKEGLDLILTMVEQQRLKFDVKIVKDWDTNIGCYLTEQNSVFNKILGTFTTKSTPKIIIRQISANVMAHEMAHALEIEARDAARITLGETFRKAIGLDMKDRSPNSLALKGEIKRLMVDALKAYPQHQFISELFARFFELLSVSRDLSKTSGFSSAEVMDFFPNTTNFVTKIFNPAIKPRISSTISLHTTSLIKNFSQSQNNTRFADNTEKFQRVEGGWSKNVNTNAMWNKSWKKHEALQSSKNKELNDDSKK